MCSVTESVGHIIPVLSAGSRSTLLTQSYLLLQTPSRRWNNNLRFFINCANIPANIAPPADLFARPGLRPPAAALRPEAGIGVHFSSETWGGQMMHDASFQLSRNIFCFCFAACRWLHPWIVIRSQRRFCFRTVNFVVSGDKMVDELAKNRQTVSV